MGGLLIMSKKLTYEEVELFVRNNSSCELLSKEYVNNSTKMIFKCKCGNKFEKTFQKFKNRKEKHCQECGRRNQINKRKLDYNEVESYIKQNTNGELLTKKYINSKSKMKFRCSCGNIFYKTFESVKRYNSAKCKRCQVDSMKKKQSLDYLDVFMEFKKFNYELVDSKYVNAVTKIIVKCDKGHLFKTTYSDFKNGNRCSQCRKDNMSKLFRKEEGWIITDIETKGFKFNKWSNVYKNTRSKALITCGKGHDFISNYDRIIYANQGCPHCNESKGEKAIKKVLERKNIDFIPQFRFKGCKYKKTLPFDFYLPKNNLCIEYDGEFHYKEKSIGNDLKLQQKRDKIKNEYCKENKIKLLRIPYWEFDNIQYILESVLP